MYISWQTGEAVRITTFSIINLITYLLSNGVPYVLTELTGGRGYFMDTNIYGDGGIIYFHFIFYVIFIT